MPPSPEDGAEAAEAFVLPAVDRPDAKYDDPFATHAPAGFGPIPPFWRLRQHYAGTYDEAWQAERHPRLPEDFDYRFYQCAHPDLVLPGYLAGDEAVQFARLTPGGAKRHFFLPRVQPVARYVWSDERQVTQRLNLDGLHLDLRAEPLSVSLTWRGWLPICPSFLRIDVRLENPGDPALSSIPRAALHGIDEVA